MKQATISFGLKAATAALLTALSPLLPQAPASEPAPASGASSVADLRARAREVLGVLPEKMPGSEKDSPPQVALGRKLFFEPCLSANESQSCNSCHAGDHNRPGVDGEKTSLGAFGKRGGRNSPTVLNAGYHLAQFWDGRAETLEEQAKGPILNPVEMGMSNQQQVVARLKSDAEYWGLFAKAFPGTIDPISYDHLAQAIAAFERTLRTQDRF